MGSAAFFQKAIGHPQSMQTGNMTAMSRALSSGQYGARGAGLAELKSLGGAQAANKAAVGAHKPMKTSGAYPPGPKV